MTPARSPASRAGQCGSASSRLADDEPPRLEPRRPRHEPGAGGETRGREWGGTRGTVRAPRWRAATRGRRTRAARRRTRTTGGGAAAAAGAARGARRAARQRGLDLFARRHPAARARARGSRARRRRARTRAASASGRPAASSAASAPLTVSPAPVVSTTSTFVAGSRTGEPPGSSRSAPSRAQRDEHGRSRRRDQRARGRRRVVARPSAAVASEAFGVSTASGTSGSARAGAGLSTTGHPAAAAARAAAITTASETSWQSSRTPPPSPDRSSAVTTTQRRVGARGDRDLVLARVVDHDQRDAGRLRQPRDPGDVDALGRQLRDGRAPHLVVADRTHERHRCSQPCRSDRLVGRLATAVPREAPARDGLARRGQRRDDDHEVDVDRSDDDDSR